MNKEEKKMSPEELMKSFFDDNKLANMDKESLKHWDNIFNSILELKRLNNDVVNHSMAMWSLFLMTVFPFPNKDLKSIEDEINKAKLSGN